LRGSNQAKRHTTERARRRQRSGSTPHDPITGCVLSELICVQLFAHCEDRCELGVRRAASQQE
jgi:hypothetical protein